MTNQTLKAWHFVGDTLRDRSPVPLDGQWLRVKGRLVMCHNGLHAAVRILDALIYAPGDTVCRVDVRGDIERGSDKLVARERMILWRIDAEEILRDFARRCALDVVHLWDAPDIIIEYLNTGNENLKDTTRVAAAYAARYATWDAARDAARAAAWAATKGRARDVARDVACAANWAATSDTVRGAAWNAAWNAAWDAARDAQNRRLTSMVLAAHHKQIGSP